MRLDGVQVEVTTHCQLRCVMCPRSVFDDWVCEHMDVRTFTAIPFENFRYVHLQGWGEPLMNPRIVDMIEFVKDRGCTVGITTNGVLLGKLAPDLLSSGIDVVAISIAGAKDETQKRIRGFPLSELLENVEILSGLRRGDRPRITLVTMMLKDTISELPKLVELARDVGADELIANNLDYIPSERLLGLEVFSERENERFSKVIKEAEALAKELGVKFLAKPIKLEEVLVCAENPIRNCLVTVRGDVCPCVYLHLPTKSDRIVRFFRGRRVEVGKTYFGNVREGFANVWNGEEYRSFRGVFSDRLKSLNALLYTVSFPSGVLIPELPDVCRTCYKAYSV